MPDAYIEILALRRRLAALEQRIPATERIGGGTGGGGGSSVLIEITDGSTTGEVGTAGDGGPGAGPYACKVWLQGYRDSDGNVRAADVTGAIAWAVDEVDAAWYVLNGRYRAAYNATQGVYEFYSGVAKSL